MKWRILLLSLIVVMIVCISTTVRMDSLFLREIENNSTNAFTVALQSPIVPISQATRRIDPQPVQSHNHINSIDPSTRVAFIGLIGAVLVALIGFIVAIYQSRRSSRLEREKSVIEIVNIYRQQQYEREIHGTQYLLL